MPYRLPIVTYVLDDDLDELEILKFHLEEVCGVHLEFFTDITDFINGIQHGMHIGIIDHRLNASVDGIEVGRMVLQKNPTMFLILYSGSNDKKVWQRATNSGFSGLIDKNDPHSILQIADMVAEQKEIIREKKMYWHGLYQKYSTKYPCHAEDIARTNA